MADKTQSPSRGLAWLLHPPMPGSDNARSVSETLLLTRRNAARLLPIRFSQMLPHNASRVRDGGLKLWQQRAEGPNSRIRNHHMPDRLEIAPLGATGDRSQHLRNVSAPTWQSPDRHFQRGSWRAPTAALPVLGSTAQQTLCFQVHAPQIVLR